jgi:hypothetical protein
MSAEATSVDPKATPLFHLVIVGEDGDWPEVHKFLSRDKLVAFLKAVKPSFPTRAYIFCGRRLFISKGPYRCLLDGKEDPIALFDVKVCREPDPDDFLWDDPVEEPDPGYVAFLKSLEPSEPDRGKATKRE